MIYHARLLGILVLTVGMVLAQENGKTTQSSSNDVEVRFHDGSVVRMTVLQDSLEIATKFGKLAVPAKDILKIEFGVHLADGMGKKIEELVKDLGSNAFHEREAAGKALVAYGPKSYAALVAAARSKDQEVSQRAQALLKNLREQFSAEQLQVRENDLIQTTEFPIIGRVITPTLRTRTAYFGEMEVQLVQVQAIRRLVHADRKEVVVDATKYGNGQWMDTGIEVSAETHLNIKATGEVDLQPNNPGQIVCGPAGLNQGGFNPGVMGKAGARRQGGTLLGRIGEGPVFVIGEHYQGRSTQAGKLQLQIAPSPWGGETGSYTVTIHFGETQEVVP
jgi:hypothetical protein